MAWTMACGSMTAICACAVGGAVALRPRLRTATAAVVATSLRMARVLRGGWGRGSDQPSCGVRTFEERLGQRAEEGRGGEQHNPEHEQEEVVVQWRREDRDEAGRTKSQEQ